MKAGGRGLLLVVSGASGAGKTTVAKGLLTNPGFARAVTATTRPPRAGERDGVDYHFLDEATFLQRIAQGAFLEHAEVHGRLYGTPRSAVEEILASGRVCVLVIDVQGADSLRRQGVDAFHVFVTAPSLDELERRLRDRGTDSDAVIARRLAEAPVEIAQAGQYDAVVMNDDVERAIGEIGGLVRARLGRR